MRATGVLVRFLSLLDVALILLGVLMITLMQVQLRSQVAQSGASSSAMNDVANIEFVYLYAGWKGPESGRCYLLNASREVGREVRTDTADDINAVLATRKNQNERANHVVMLLFGDDGWYSAWDAQKLTDIEQAWKIKIVPIYNVRLSPKESR